MEQSTRTRAKKASTTTRLAKIEAELAEQRRINASTLSFARAVAVTLTISKPRISLPTSGSLFGKPVAK